MDLRSKTISPKMKNRHLILCDLPTLGLLVFFTSRLWETLNFWHSWFSASAFWMLDRPLRLQLVYMGIRHRAMMAKHFSLHLWMSLQSPFLTNAPPRELLHTVRPFSSCRQHSAQWTPRLLEWRTIVMVWQRRILTCPLSLPKHNLSFLDICSANSYLWKRQADIKEYGKPVYVLSAALYVGREMETFTQPINRISTCFRQHGLPRCTKSFLFFLLHAVITITKLSRWPFFFPTGRNACVNIKGCA